MENTTENKENITEKKVYDKPYVCNHKSNILFGKFKGLKHEVFLLPENRGYVQWLYSKRNDIKYDTTLNYIRQHLTVEELTPEIKKA